MAAAFGSGALFSIVSGMGTPNPVANAITTGVGFAVFQGGFFMVRIWGLGMSIADGVDLLLIKSCRCCCCFLRVGNVTSPCLLYPV
jgi:hypothetical protein